MNVTILCVGKIKESFYRDAILEYSKRLGRYCKFVIVEVSDEQTPEKMSDSQEDIIKKKEADRILKHINSNSYIFTLEILGKKYDSVSFAERIDYLSLQGKSDITFIIGGSLGLHNSVSRIANEKISFSDMTFPHQLMRVILSEQIYRAYRIINHEPYHK